ncbi:DNA-binding MarR family transcriptional regulator/N-acetylglutamate synthase-like GNAT family acetyltransferase [Flavobacterium nitrogenifigens]|uniref:DNA-binding MarR family transcriptional regulator/N-acetylglutamate synthase-like GNAT family acetyltransferase n=2 Tax=Flavobacterium TaxID=237 RepID=A0A7W7N7Z2_9FLAO|nr:MULTISPECIES: bifunctional helix-turn-helix transcriptional regulator/GNAT family N-acetyltransferase [Flavobacterium]MBB4801842.1 DNA-binding MarR family transcriptional regulator/N-acetylglutamate synthase-like GNAT family acetyltransferase [Flavobacterium nitrogenifigens]MBB6386800.1 DNA-binding MarR family transcriptional regulator/N-acetylglutamate synthase-like GNAT family acetyltransferase [Flavobacterium notoginsengisoli]
MEFFNKVGKVALGSRLRLMTASFTDDASKIYELYGVDFNPKWFPVFYTIAEDREITITEIANEIGHSQPSVSKIIQEMIGAGILEEGLKTEDKRKNNVVLTKKGIEISEKIKQQLLDIDVAVEGLISEAKHNLWAAVEEWEFLLQQKSLFKRVSDQKKLRESKNVKIVEYDSKYKDAFKALNVEWISTYFEMEESDYKALDNPEDYIINKGGKILVALYENEPVGVCALIKSNVADYDFEMAKMAVSPKAQGKSIGWLLGKAIADKAKELGAKKIYLESNTILKPAINLYYKLGFEKVFGLETPYKRCNIQMELILS